MNVLWLFLLSTQLTFVLSEGPVMPSSCRDANYSESVCKILCYCSWCDNPIKGYNCIYYDVIDNHTFNEHNCSSNINKLSCKSESVISWIVITFIAVGIIALFLIFFYYVGESLLSSLKECYNHNKSGYSPI